MEKEKLQIEHLLKLQDELNCQISSQWRAEQHKWYRAIWTEAAELLDHLGWKWWRQQETDLAQVKLELVDILHFGLSDLLQHTPRKEELIESIYQSFSPLFDLNSSSISLNDTFSDKLDESLRLVEGFACETLMERCFPVRSFVQLCVCLGINFQLIYALFVAKQTLNRFRQDNGYQEGSYRKIWSGREDNCHLVDIVEQLNSLESDFSNHLYLQLKRLYSQSLS